MEMSRADMASVPMELKMSRMVMVSACNYLKGHQGRKTSFVLCQSREQDWNHVEALVGRFRAEEGRT